MCPRTEEIYDIDDTKEIKTVSTISSVDDSCCEMLGTIENIPTFELGYSKTLEDGKTEVQEAAEIKRCNKHSTQVTSDVTGILTPSAAHEDGPFVMCQRTEEIYDIDDTKERKSVSPISRLDDSCCEMSHIIENIPSFELGYSNTLEDGKTEV